MGAAGRLGASNAVFFFKGAMPLLYDSQFSIDSALCGHFDTGSTPLSWVLRSS